MIPKIIHQTWIDNNIPYHIYDRRWIDSWKKYNPDWEYKFWTDEDLRNLVKNKYEWFLPTYDAYPRNILRVDAARYFILYEYGGLYVDLDFECLKSFDHLLNNQLVVGFSHQKEYTTIKYYDIPNALMMSVPNHPFWDLMFEKMQQGWRNYNLKNKYKNVFLRNEIHFLTGSCLLYYMIYYYKMFLRDADHFKKEITIYPSSYFYPIKYSADKENYVKDVKEYLSKENNSYAVTYWSFGWNAKYQWKTE